MKKNLKTILIILSILVLILITATITAVITYNNMSIYDPNYLYNLDGTITIGNDDLLEMIKNVEDPQIQQEQIEYALENGLATYEDIYGIL